MPEPAKTLIVAQERTRRTFLVFVFSRSNKTILRVIPTRGTMPTRYLGNIRWRKLSVAHPSNRQKTVDCLRPCRIKLNYFTSYITGGISNARTREKVSPWTFTEFRIRDHSRHCESNLLAKGRINSRVQHNGGNKKLEFTRSNMEQSSAGIFYARYIFTPILHRRFACRFLPLCTFVRGPFSFHQRTINSCGHWYAINVLASLPLCVRTSQNREGQ